MSVGWSQGTFPAASTASHPSRSVLTAGVPSHSSYSWAGLEPGIHRPAAPPCPAGHSTYPPSPLASVPCVGAKSGLFFPRLGTVHAHTQRGAAQEWVRRCQRCTPPWCGRAPEHPDPHPNPAFTGRQEPLPPHPGSHQPHWHWDAGAPRPMGLLSFLARIPGVWQEAPKAGAGESGLGVLGPLSSACSLHCSALFAAQTPPALCKRRTALSSASQRRVGVPSRWPPKRYSPSLRSVSWL